MAFRLCTGGQWITWIAGSGHKLMVEKKLHGIFSRAEVSSFQDPNWSTGELGSSCVISVAQPTRSSARRTLVLKTVFPSRDIVSTSECGGYPYLGRVTTARGARLFHNL